LVRDLGLKGYQGTVVGIDYFVNYETQLCPPGSQTAYTEMVKTCRWNEFVYVYIYVCSCLWHIQVFVCVRTLN